MDFRAGFLYSFLDSFELQAAISLSLKNKLSPAKSHLHDQTVFLTFDFRSPYYF